MKNKWNWSEIKDRVLMAIKLHFLILTMSIGIWFSYAMLYMLCGFPLTNLALWLIFIAALLTELAYLKWLTD